MQLDRGSRFRPAMPATLLSVFGFGLIAVVRIKVNLTPGERAMAKRDGSLFAPVAMPVVRNRPQAVTLRRLAGRGYWAWSWTAVPLYVARAEIITGLKELCATWRAVAASRAAAPRILPARTAAR